MQNVQNAAEIQQRSINLVELYYTSLTSMPFCHPCSLAQILYVIK